MNPTATHRFVFLSLHVAYADGVVQPQERDAMSNAARRIGIAAGLPAQQVDDMVTEATDWYHDSVEQGTVERDVQDCVASLGIFREDIKVALLRELRMLAMAADGVDREEHILLTDLREAWGIETVSR